MSGKHARRAYLERIFELLEQPRGADIHARALVVVAKWENVAGADPRHIQRWRALLGGETGAMRRSVMADTPEGAELRHWMPFAGVLSNRERSELRAR